jgi:hypothetical protein
MNDLIINFEIEGLADLKYVSTMVKNSLKEFSELEKFNYKIKVIVNLNM